jgi:hypothetical protein
MSAPWTSHQFWGFLKTVGVALTGVALLIAFGVALGVVS